MVLTALILLEITQGLYIIDLFRIDNERIVP